MKYKVIIKELKEAADPNVLAFLKDVESKKQLSRDERQYYMVHLHESGAPEIIVNDFIPAIIRVAYSYSQKTKKLTFLDLVGEGVVGAYKFIEKYKHRKGADHRLLRQYVICAIQRVICKQECPLSFCSFDEEDPRLYKDAATEALQSGSVVFCAGGTGHPYFSTDTGVVLRAVELECDEILLAKAIDGVYDSDPKKNPNAKKYDTIRIQDVVDQRLGVIDLPASVICMENHMPLAIFSLNEENGISNALKGIINGTRVTAD